MNSIWFILLSFFLTELQVLNLTGKDNDSQARLSSYLQNPPFLFIVSFQDMQFTEMNFDLIVQSKMFFSETDPNLMLMCIENLIKPKMIIDNG